MIRERQRREKRKRNWNWNRVRAKTFVPYCVCKCPYSSKARPYSLYRVPEAARVKAGTLKNVQEMKLKSV